jgi:solute carrier family 8 (sodium/calcium exchanger)
MQFTVPVGSLGFSVTVFCIESIVAVAILILKRRKSFGGGELGGPRAVKLFTAGVFIFLWVLFVILSSLDEYGIIKTVL